MHDKCKLPICDEVQTHVHEFEGSTQLDTIVDEYGKPILELLHNHRFAGVTSQVQPKPTKCNPRDHTHTICVNSDFFFNHFHEITLQTGPVIPVFDPKSGQPIGHVHAIVGTSSRVFCHDHDFKSNTIIQNPIDGPFVTKLNKVKKEKEEMDDEW